MLHFDRGTWRRVGYAIVLAVVFLVVNAQVAHAASGSGGDMLSPLNIDTSEGVPIDGYELSSRPGSLFSVDSNAYSFIMGGLFTLIRLLVGLACWAIEFAFRFPLLNLLSDPAQKVSDAYNKAVVDTLGLKKLMLAWAFVFGLILFVRGKAAKGLGEIALTLLIAAFAASAFVRPDYLLAENGPLAQTEKAASEVARDAVNSHDWGGKISSGDPGPCSGMSGPAEQKCWKIEDDKPLKSTDVARPLQDSLTNALVVKGYMLLQYGRTLDPGKPADRKAYALHLRWVSGGYKAGGADDQEAKEEAKDACSLIKGPAKKHCEEGIAGETSDGKTSINEHGLPALTAGDALLEATSPIVSEEDQQFEAFLDDLRKQGGPVGKASAKYAEKSTGWRAAGALMLFVAALLICAIPLSSAIVMLGTQAADAGAAAVGGITLVWAMLPGPSRQAAWKWLAVLAVSVAGLFAICMFLPFYGIAIDVILTDGPDLPAERLLALDFLAFAGVAFHRYLMRAISSFGQRMSMRMRFAKVGGTHLPGDSSEIGAALAMGSAGSGGYGLGGGLRGLAGGGAYGRLGTRQRIMQSLAAMTDGAGMPIDSGQVLADVGAEMSRGLAPVAIAATGARLGVRGGWGLLVGKRPDDKTLERLRKPTGSEGDRPAGGEGEGSAGARTRREGAPDRYRDTDGKVTDRWSGEILHDQDSDRTLLTTRAHNRLVRLRGYRILNRSGRVAYGASYGLPSNVRRAGVKRSQYSQDTRQQLQVWGNTVREDGREWANGYRHTRRVLRENTDDRGADAPFTSRTLRTTSTPTARPAGRPSSEGPTRPSGSGDSWSRLVFGDGAAGADSRGSGTGSGASAAGPERPRPRPAPRRDPAEERRRFIERMGAGDTPETRRRVQEEMRRRYGDTNGTGGDGGESG